MRLRLRGAAWLLVASVFVFALGAAACGGGSPTSPSTDPSQNLSVAYSQTDLVVGTGRVAANGNNVSVNYTGWLYNPSAAENKGTQFGTSALRGPLTFRLGTGQNNLISGWNQGIPGMAVGGRRRLVLPPNLAYGSTGNGPIPPNATILFDIEMVNITD